MSKSGAMLAARILAELKELSTLTRGMGKIKIKE